MHQTSEPDTGRSAPTDILHPGSRALFRYWESIRGERSAPHRSDIDLRAIRGVLPWVGILERRGEDKSYRWRLAGTGICRLWGRDLTGCDLLDGWPGFERQSLLGLLDGVVDGLQPFVARFTAEPELHEPVGVEFLALPTQAKDESIHVLCASLPFIEPAWLGWRPLLKFELSSVRIIWTEPVPGDPLASLRAESGIGRTTQSPLKVIRGGLAE
jgi:hypothetical protein